MIQQHSATLTNSPEQAAAEFDRQVENLLLKRYPEAAGLSIEQFLKPIEPLRVRAEALTIVDKDLEQGRLPFVIVIKSDLVPTESAIAFVERNQQHGVIKLYPHEPADFSIIGDVRIPDGMAYLLVDIDRGRESINLPPIEAMASIKNAGRSPLTIDEGVAIITQYPDFLMKNNCFFLLASRHTGDKRVPAIWINTAKRPNLGWCWEGNPHTWLGSASCDRRIGSDA